MWTIGTSFAIGFLLDFISKPLDEAWTYLRTTLCPVYVHDFGQDAVMTGPGALQGLSLTKTCKLALLACWLEHEAWLVVYILPSLTSDCWQTSELDLGQK